MANAPENSLDRRFDALLNRQVVLLFTFYQANDRRHRLVASLVDAVQQDSREWTEVGRNWLRRPTDVMGLMNGVLDASVNSQGRALAAARGWLDDLQKARPEWSTSGRALEEAPSEAPTVFRRPRPARKRTQPEPVPPTEVEAAEFFS